MANASDNKKPRAAKLGGALIGLGSAAIVSVYTVGYVNTQSSIDQMAASVSVPTASPAPTNSQRSPQPTQSSTAPQPTVVPSGGTSASLKDGSYVGFGNSRHGGMQVKIVISKGKITSAAVVSCGTRYPCSDISPLISEVVSSQTVPVDHVSGATDSSGAYRQAVSSALTQAKSAS